MTRRNRQVLTQAFSEGQRPTGENFADWIESSFNQVDDGLSIDSGGNLLIAGNPQIAGSLRISQDLVLGTGSSANQAGSLRYNGDQVEFNNGSNWLGLSSGGGGAFQPVGETGGVAYGEGNVGIGSFGGSGPTYRFEVDLAAGDTDANRVRLGAAVIFGSGNEAYFAHQGVNDLETDFALRQERSGEVRINAPNGERIRFDQGGNQPRLAIADSGNVIVGLNRDIPGRSDTFQVNGTAFKNQGGDMWATTSDLRVKEDIRDLEIGLDAVLQIRPVRFSFNGKAGTPKGVAGIGIIGQEMETVLPETIQYAVNNDAALAGEEPLRLYNGSALTYVLVNAVKELTARVQQLEADLAAERQGRSPR